MTTFFLCFLTTLMATIAGRDSVRVAWLSASLGRTSMLLIAIVIASCCYAPIATWLARTIAPVLQGGGALLFVAFALAIAGGEIILMRAGKRPKEPTRSVAAIVLVQCASLLTGSAGFLLIAFTVLKGQPIVAAIGGAMGAMTALSIAATAGEDWDKFPQAILRNATGILLFLAAIVIGYQAFTWPN